MDASALDVAITALENEVSRLEVSIDGLEKWLWISSAAVVIGVTLELWFLIHEYREDRDTWLRGIIIPPSRPIDPTQKNWRQRPPAFPILCGVTAIAK